MSDEIYAHLGARIRQVREASRLTQVDLARRVGLSRSSIANIEAGRQAVYFHQAVCLAEALGLALSDFTPPTPGGKPRVEADTSRIQQIIRDSEEYIVKEAP